MNTRWHDVVTSAGVLAQGRRRLAAGERLDVSGLTGAARPLVALLVTARPLVVVVASEAELDATAADLRTLAAETEQPGEVVPFPAPGPLPFRGLARHPEAALRRAAALYAARRGTVRAWVATPAGLMRPCLQPELFATRILSLVRSEEMTPEIVCEALVDAGYRTEDPVVSAGQFARRGGIVDVFPPDQDLPVRLEFLGDTIDSLRSFDPVTQRSQATIDRLELAPISDLFVTRSTLPRLGERLRERLAGVREAEGFLRRLERGPLPEELSDYLPLVTESTVPAWRHLKDAAVVVIEPDAVREAAAALWQRAHEQRSEALALEPEEALTSLDALLAFLEERPAIHMHTLTGEPDAVHAPCRPVRRYSGDLRALIDELKGRTGRTVLFLGNPGRAERLSEVLGEDGLVPAAGSRLEVRVGTLSAGFEWTDGDLLLLSDGDIFPEEVHLPARSRRRRGQGLFSNLKDLRIGDLVVHEQHGLGRFEGLETLDVLGVRSEFMVLSYQGGDKLKVPVYAFDQVQKFRGLEGGRPILARLGSGKWGQVKRRIRKAMRDMASELLRLYAERKARPGHAFVSDNPWLHEFEDAFDFEETLDQAAAIQEVANDMAAPTPMDRLICGDVGYGKTEVAMRAAMRAVLDGKQVGLLAPTTVLAYQHWQTFRKRFAPFPVRVEMVSRFRSAREIKTVLADTASGKVEILIGTHRLLSKDVVFKDLGLLLVDEEQRFGVAAKERLKHLRKSVDCLTLSATPIPRTLQMGLAGIRDMSVIETPPKDRLAIHTSVVRFATATITAAIRQELARGGQVYFVHNRVESIYSLANLIQRLCPEARVAVAHGQMPEAELERAMLTFVEGRADVLACTTIIENGLDIPRANTIIINRADRYGLAQLYQLRGRVGRSDRRAYAYLLVPPDRVLSELARKRLAAIQEFSDLGAGFRVAALDLELRGAGNLLGGQQSGHIEAVGLDLYIKLLEQTIQELKGEEPREGPQVVLNLGVDLRIPADYVPDMQQRMELYRRLSQAGTEEDLANLRAEISDRYGAVPPGVERLFRYADCRRRAASLGVAQVDRSGRDLVVRFDPARPPAQDALARVVRQSPGSSLASAAVLKVPLAEDDVITETGRLLDVLTRASRPDAGRGRGL